MPVTCATCANWNLKGSPLRHHGLGLCKFEMCKATTYGADYPRECPRFAPAAPDVIAARQRALNPKEPAHAPD